MLVHFPGAPSGARRRFARGARAGAAGRMARCVARALAAPVVLAAAAVSPLPAQPAAQPAALSTARPSRAGPDTLALARVVDRLERAAAAANPALAARRAALDAARARAQAAGFAPPAFASGGLSEAPNGRVDQGNVRLEVGRDLLTGPRRRAERAVAEADVAAEAAAFAAAERQVRAALVRTLVRAVGARGVAARLAAEDALLAGAEDGVRVRFAVGDARYVDVLRLRTERLRVQSERAATLADGRAALAALGGVLGDGQADAQHPGRGDLLAALDTVAAGGLADAWPWLLPAPLALDTLVTAAGDVRLAEAAVGRARAAGTLAAATRRPQVSAVAGVQRIGQANQGATFGPSLGLTVSLPFTAARATRLGAVADARVVAAATAARGATVAAVRARVLAAAARYAAARERLAVFDAALLRGAREERESALAAYRTRGLSLLELVDFERALARAEIDRTRALVDAADAWADLVTGGGAADERGAMPSLSASGAP